MASSGQLAAAAAAAVLLACSGGPNAPAPSGPACVPTTCGAAGANCGSVSDGCSGMLACGTCGAGQACGGGGTPNVCGAGAPKSGALQWLSITRPPVVSVTSDRAGAVAVLRGDASSKAIARMDAAGNVVWTRDVGADAAEITLDASGAIYILGGFENPQRGARIDRLSADGSTLTNVAKQGTDLHVYSRVSVNGRGDWVHTFNIGSGDSSINLHHADGTVAFLVESDDFSVFFQAVGLDDSGNVLAAAYAREPFTRGGRSYPRGLYLLKLNRNLEIIWIQPLPLGQARAIATTRLGTAVVLGRDAVAVFEATGAQRFSRALPPGKDDDSWHLAVDPAGKMTLGATLPGCDGAMVREINLAGDELWTRKLTSDACDVTVDGVATVTGGALAGGGFDGAVDFGKGPASGGGGFLGDYLY